MKKHSILKVMLISVLVLVFLTWIIPASTYTEPTLTIGKRSMLGFWEIFNFPNDSIAYFGDYILFTVLIGAFYGILSKVGAYRVLLGKIVDVFKGKEKWFLVGLMILIGVITSFTGLTFELFIFIPLLISVILLMGYDKLVALSATVGSILVGLIGSIYGYYGAGVLNSVLTLKFNSQILVKTFLFIIPMYLLISYTLSYIKEITKKDKKDKKGKKEEKNEVVEEDPMLVSKKTEKVSVKLWPVVSVLAFIFVIAVMGYITWEYTFNVTAFSNFHTWLMGLHIGNFYIFGELFGNAPAFGVNWWLSDLSVLLSLTMIFLVLIYRMKFNDIIEGLVDGVKKMIPIIVVIILVNVIFLIFYSNQINLTFLDWLLTDKFNYITMFLNGMIQSVSFVYLPYAAAYTLPAAISVIGDTSFNSQIAVIFQAVYGLVMFIAPTSLILLAGLAYTDVSYKKWFKYIWKLLVELLLVIVAILTIMILV